MKVHQALLNLIVFGLFLLFTTAQAKADCVRFYPGGVGKIGIYKLQ